MIHGLARFTSPEREVQVEFTFRMSVEEARKLAGQLDNSKWPSTQFGSVLHSLIHKMVDRTESAQEASS